MPDPGRDVPLQNIAKNISEFSQALTLLAENLLFQTYATGTWVPGLQFGGSAAGMSIAAQSGSYTQLGREFICRFTISLAALGSSTGVATLTGLPATANAGIFGAGGIVSSYNSLASVTSTPILRVPGGQTIAFLQLPGTTSSGSMTNGNFTNLSAFAGNFNFFI